MGIRGGFHPCHPDGPLFDLTPENVAPLFRYWDLKLDAIPDEAALAAALEVRRASRYETASIPPSDFDEGGLLPPPKTVFSVPQSSVTELAEAPLLRVMRGPRETETMANAARYDQVTIHANGVPYVVSLQHGLRLSDHVFVPPQAFPSFGGAQVRALDFEWADVALHFQGAPLFVPVRLPPPDAHRVASEFGAALVRYAPAGTPAVLAPARLVLPKDYMPVGLACPQCKGTAFEETAPAKWLRVAPRKCTSCGTAYEPPTPTWKKAVRIALDPRTWFIG